MTMMENLWTLRMPKDNPCTNQWLNQTPTTSNKQITLNPKSKSRLKSQNNLLLKNPQQPNLKPPNSLVWEHKPADIKNLAEEAIKLHQGVVK